MESLDIEVVSTVGAALLTSAMLTGVARRLALSRGVLDVPNDRSSHEVPTPRGGGVAIVLTTTAAWLALVLLGKLRTDLFIALSGGGIAVAIVGLLDDRHRVSAGARLAVHLGAAIWALAWLGGLPPMQFGDRLVSLGWAGYALGVVGIVWVLNLFNFMDGIDGIAASEAVFISWSGVPLALIAGLAGNDSGVSAAAIVLGAACFGFLLWNWPPAKIFMGDVGSGYLGYVIAVLALATTRESPVALLVWLILGGVFFVDATVTFVRRLARHERVYEAHRSHAYQWLARRWQSHRRVTILVVFVNVIWLLPCAYLAAVYPAFAVWIAVGGLAPVAVLAIAAGSGRTERVD